MSANEHKASRPYGLIAVVDLFNRILPTILLMLIGWAGHELKVQGEGFRSIKDWKEGIPSHMRVEADKLKLEVMRDVASTLGSSLSRLSESQARIEERIKNIDDRIGAMQRGGQ